MIKDWFTMTRNERRGTIVILVIVALSLMATVLLRSCPNEAPAVSEAEINRFEATVDSALSLSSQSDSIKSKHQRAPKKQHSSSKKSKPSQKRKSGGPRKMEPVPQF